MAWSTIGDLSHSYFLGLHGTRLREASATLQAELTTGVASDTRKHVGGDYAYLSDVERNLALLGSYRTAIAEATIFTDAMQNGLLTIQETTSNLGASLLLVGQSSLPENLAVAAEDARIAFSAIVDTLNMQVADRSIFSGADHDRSTLVQSDVILSTLRTELAGETTQSGVAARLDDWFKTPGGGFDTLAYGGADRPGASFQLSEGTRLTPSVRGDNSVFRELLKTTAMAALSGDGTLGLSPDVRSTLIQDAGTSILNLQPQLVDVQANIGAIQEMIEMNSARNEAAMTTMTLARNELLSVDPFESATKLEAIQTQLETMYAVMARSRQLSFLEFMR